MSATGNYQTDEELRREGAALFQKKIAHTATPDETTRGIEVIELMMKRAKATKREAAQ